MVDDEPKHQSRISENNNKMRTVALVAAVLLVVSQSAAAFKFNGWPAGCLVNLNLEPYNGNYSRSAVFLSDLNKITNSPNMLYGWNNVWNVNMFGSQLAVIGMLPKNTDLRKFNAGNAFEQSAANFSPNGQSGVAVGDTFWVVGSNSASGASSFIFQIKAYNAVSKRVNIDLFVVSFTQLSNQGYCSATQYSNSPWNEVIFDLRPVAEGDDACFGDVALTAAAGSVAAGETPSPELVANAGDRDLEVQLDVVRQRLER